MLIYLVMKNSDMTEGRGPMILDSLFLNRDKAVAYMADKPGVMGRKSRYTNFKTGHVSTGWDDKKAWPSGGDWEIHEKETSD